jgi:hypothetical protein
MKRPAIRKLIECRYLIKTKQGLFALKLVRWANRVAEKEAAA